MSDDGLVPGPKFLFHIGTIKRSSLFVLVRHNLCRFYSTLVRLKEEVSGIREVKVESFYSTLVRLKVTKIEADIKTFQSFYSTLVRLKVSELLSLKVGDVVSIPHWYD